MNSRQYKFLGFGMPRGGTLYAARVAREILGLSVGHEHIASDGVVGFGYASTDPKRGHLRIVRGRPTLGHFEVVVHLTRHPLQVIGSLEANFRRDTWVSELIAFHDPWFAAWMRHFRGGAREKWAAAWTAWHAVCERVLGLASARGCHCVRGRVESPAWVTEVSQALHPSPPVDEVKVKEMIATRINHKKDYPRVTWSELQSVCHPEVYDRVVTQAEYLGYDVEREEWAEAGAESLAHWAQDNPY